MTGPTPPTSLGALLRERVLLTLGAGLVVVAGLTAAAVLLPTRRFYTFCGLAALSFVSAGKFIVLAPALEDDVPFSPWTLAAMVTVMDLCVAMFVAGNLDALYRLPWAGKRLRGLEVNGSEVLRRRPWMRRVAFGGIVAFVMFPLAGTGAIGGTIFARLLGLDLKRTLAGIALGAVLGSFGMALFAKGLARVLVPVRDELWFKAAGPAVIVLLVAWLLAQNLRTPEEPIPGDGPKKEEAPPGASSG